jgi:hypothetical protein
VAGLPRTAKIEPLLVLRSALQKQIQKRRRDAAVQKKGAALLCGAFFFDDGFCLQE